MSKSNLYINAQQAGITSIADGEFFVVSRVDLQSVDTALDIFAGSAQTNGVLIHDPADLKLACQMAELEAHYLEVAPTQKFIRIRADGLTAHELRSELTRELSAKFGFDASKDFDAYWSDLDKQVDTLRKTSDANDPILLALCFHAAGSLQNPKWHIDKHLPPDRVRSVRNIAATGAEFALREGVRETNNGRNFIVDESVQIKEGQSIFKPSEAFNAVHRSPPSADHTIGRWSTVMTTGLVASPRVF